MLKQKSDQCTQNAKNEFLCNIKLDGQAIRRHFHQHFTRAFFWRQNFVQKMLMKLTIGVQIGLCIFVSLDFVYYSLNSLITSAHETALNHSWFGISETWLLHFL
jgi:hypothetical protein